MPPRNGAGDRCCGAREGPPGRCAWRRPSSRLGRAGGMSMLRFRLPVLVVAAVVAAVVLTMPAGVTPANVDVSQRHLNESEEAIAVNPTNPNNIVVFTNVGHAEAGLTAGMFLGVSFDGGKSWTRRLVGLGAGDPLGDTCCDPSLSFDRYGNLFMTYLYQVENQVPVAPSTD